jgi:Fe-S-cluster containining protein
MAGSCKSDQWYRDGLRFECTLCGKCCSGEAGYVWVSVDEARALAEGLGMGLDDFGRRYLRRVGQRYSLTEDAQSRRCVFLDDNRCSVHELRPSQCRCFPFWSQNLKDRTAWNEAATQCEGINTDAPLIDADTIDRLRRA